MDFAPGLITTIPAESFLSVNFRLKLFPCEDSAGNRDGRRLGNLLRGNDSTELYQQRKGFFDR